ncbi:hypothetical protein DICPUDRAFT_47305 [Dictyostelium purpureum]|uniref:Uncharacterized protein n=1 Tax=Dictyostelium purpureum TaxID=5786 RepID=F0ZIW7_DICPU|nr:uncharacterized protein DICPUDRAFT_47305 [Dictyostelium purpureum]EGC36098.1 hypothetical protein DICPUDRAFT_47305 [Dictyostelium purpureum]|eukprot:XP_003287355.1 hypothetical protein DICPUDRAFT_47305 [Dictyostelium purpureum]
MIKINLDRIYEIIEAYLKAYLREGEVDENHLLFYKYFRDLTSVASDHDKLSNFLNKEEYKNLPIDFKDSNEIRNRSVLILKEISNSF